MDVLSSISVITVGDHICQMLQVCSSHTLQHTGPSSPLVAANAVITEPSMLQLEFCEQFYLKKTNFQCCKLSLLDFVLRCLDSIQASFSVLASGDAVVLSPSWIDAHG